MKKLIKINGIKKINLIKKLNYIIFYLLVKTKQN